jgi:hypothetical protein
MRRLVLLPSLFLLAACAPQVSVTSSGTSGSGGAPVLGSGGMGGGTSTGNLGFGGFTGSGTGGAFMCAEPDAAYFIELEGDGAPQNLDSGCNQAMPWGHFFESPAGGGGLGIHACLTGTTVNLRLDTGLMMVGTDSMAYANYTDASGVDWHPGAPGTMKVTAYGAVGGAIEGTFALNVEPWPADGGGAPLSLSGAFYVCHRPDLIAP